MSDQKSWLHSDIYDRADSAANRLPRTSIFKFGSFRDVLAALGKLTAQSLISQFLFIMLLIVLIQASTENDQYFLTVSEIIKLICSTISVFLVARIADDIEIKELGLQVNRLALQDFAVAFGVACAVLGFEFLLDLGSGAIVIQGAIWRILPWTNIFWSSLLTLVIFIFVGWSEELLSRGFHLRVLSKGLNRPLGVILSSAIFSYLHHNNPGMTVEGYIYIFAAGVVMAWAFLRSGNLWLAMGLHAGWDFFGVMVWGWPISSLRIFHLLDVALIPGVALPEFLVKMLELALMAAFVYMYTRRRKVETRDW